MDERIEQFRTALKSSIAYGDEIMEDEFQLVRTPAYDKFNGINISSEVSFLIKEVGRLCEYYASDLYFDLKQLYHDLMDDSVLFNQDEYLWVVGIREMGCDSEYFISNRLEHGEAERNYHKIYAIEVHKTDGNMFKMSLVNIDPYVLQRVFDGK